LTVALGCSSTGAVIVDILENDTILNYIDFDKLRKKTSYADSLDKKLRSLSQKMTANVGYKKMECIFNGLKTMEDYWFGFLDKSNAFKANHANKKTQEQKLIPGAFAELVLFILNKLGAGKQTMDNGMGNIAVFPSSREILSEAVLFVTGSLSMPLIFSIFSISLLTGLTGIKVLIRIFGEKNLGIFGSCSIVCACTFLILLITNKVTTIPKANGEGEPKKTSHYSWYCLLVEFVGLVAILSLVVHMAVWMWSKTGAVDMAEIPAVVDTLTVVEIPVIEIVNVGKIKTFSDFVQHLSKFWAEGVAEVKARVDVRRAIA